MGHLVDVWYGIGFGQSLRIPGELIDEGRRIRITHEPWLNNIGWDEPYEYPAQKLGNDFRVRYDDYAYSEPGTVPSFLLKPNASIINTDELYPNSETPVIYTK